METSINQPFIAASHLPAIKTILLAGLLAGTLDGLAAIIVYVQVLGLISFSQLFQGIARGVFGKSAFSGGTPMVLYGIFFHYLIAYIFSIIYFFMFPIISFFRLHKFLSGLLYGLLVWLVMNLLVLPLVKINMPFHLVGVIRGIVILMICVGLPVSFIVSRYYIKYGKANG